MGQLTGSIESAISDSDNEDADIESEEVSEEEEPGEELVEEDPDDDDEPHEVDSCEEPVKYSCGPNEEETHEEQCEEVTDVDEFCEELEEPSEEEPDKEPIEEEVDEEPAEQELEKGPVEEGPDEEEQSEDPEEDPSEDKPSGGSHINRSCSRNNDKSSQPYTEKMSMAFDTAPGPKRIHELSAVQNPSNNKIVPEKLATAENTGRKRRSRWDIVGAAKELTDVSDSMIAEKGATEGSGGSEKLKKKKRKTWSDDNSQISTASPLEHPSVAIAQEILQLEEKEKEKEDESGGSNKLKKKKRKTWSDDNSQVSTASLLENPMIAIAQDISQLEEQLLQITNKLQYGVVDERDESEREAVLRSKLQKQRQTIILELICKNPNFKPPPDYSHHKTIYVPTKEYPGYNFIGLILGPRGNTLKRMEWETGAKILLRGKSCGHEGTVWSNKPKPDDEVYVMVAADNRYSFDAAVAMVEKLLVPVEDGHNAHKLAQLRELAELNGTLRGADTNNYGKPDTCNVCGDAAHPTSACPLTAPASGTSSNSHRVNFFAEMGGGHPSFTAPTLPVATPPPGGSAAAPASKLHNEIDDANIFIGMLPDSLADAKKLRDLFTPFGPICQADVIRDKSTGLSKGYGFVRYTDRGCAVKAVAEMNGYKIEGKRLVVRISRNYLPPVNQRASYPRPPAIPEKINHWPGPPESRLPETVAAFPNTSYLPVHDSPFSGQYSASLAPAFQTPTPTATSLFSGGFATSDELAHFPGYLKSLDPPHFPGYLKSLDPPSQLYHRSATLTSSHSSSQVPFPQNFGGYPMPPT